MPHGAPDYGMYAAKETIVSLADMAELAVRLGSMVTFDRRGDVIWMDNFASDLLSYFISLSGTGASAAISADRSLHGAFSLKATCGSTLSRSVTISRFFTYPALVNLGFEMSFTLDTHTENANLYFELYNGTTLSVGLVRVNYTDKKLQYYNSDGDIVDLDTGLSLYASDYMFHTLKFVIDWQNKKYVRALFNDLSYDMSAYSIYETSETTAKRIRVRMLFSGEAGENPVHYVDRLIITQNEP